MPPMIVIRTMRMLLLLLLLLLMKGVDAVVFAAAQHQEQGHEKGGKGHRRLQGTYYNGKAFVILPILLFVFDIVAIDK